MTITCLSHDSLWAILSSMSIYIRNVWLWHLRLGSWLSLERSMMKSSTLLNVNPPPPTSTSRPSDVIHMTGVPGPSPFFYRSSASVNANKNRRGLGTRLDYHMSDTWLALGYSFFYIQEGLVVTFKIVPGMYYLKFVYCVNSFWCFLGHFGTSLAPLYPRCLR